LEKELELLYNSPFLLEIKYLSKPGFRYLKMYHLTQLFLVLSYRFFCSTLRDHARGRDFLRAAGRNALPGHRRSSASALSRFCIGIVALATFSRW
jgi:hypothetical protein